MKEIIFPQLLYHGTLDLHLESFQKRLLNHIYWRPDRDFGAGFYTTISLSQAKKWACQTAEKYVGIKTANPIVLAVELVKVPDDAEYRLFLTESLSWAAFVFVHRQNTRRDFDPCDRHPELLIGPMADNNTGAIVQDAVKLNKDVQWFHDQITRTPAGRRLDSSRLGNQVVFASERFETYLQLCGHYAFNGRRWQYHDSAGKSEIGSL
ncbi:MAG TPA: DUF3990 domain-containing protein [Bacilli bacterium]